MERILYSSIAALLEATRTSFVGLPRFLKDEHYRLEILEQVHNPIIHGFFAEEYAIWDDDYRTTAIDPVLNKVEQLLAAPAVCAMLGSISASIDLREIMDEQKVLICNLAKGNLGAGHVSLIGAMIVSTLSNAAARRGAETIDDHRRMARVPFHLHVDEVENFVTDAFKDILSEARKWKLSLVLAHQFREQLPPKLRAAVLANVGSIVAFQTMGEDADSLAREIGLDKNADFLTQLSRGEVSVKHPTYGGP